MLLVISSINFLLLFILKLLANNSLDGIPLTTCLLGDCYFLAVGLLTGTDEIILFTFMGLVIVLDA